MKLFAIEDSFSDKFYAGCQWCDDLSEADLYKTLEEASKVIYKYKLKGCTVIRVAVTNMQSTYTHKRVKPECRCAVCNKPCTPTNCCNHLVRFIEQKDFYDNIWYVFTFKRTHEEIFLCVKKI